MSEHSLKSSDTLRAVMSGNKCSFLILYSGILDFRKKSKV